MKTSTKRIEITPLELAMLKRHLNGDFFPPDQTKEEMQAMCSVIDKADNYMAELDAYDELGTSLMKWFYKKYQQQVRRDKQKETQKEQEAEG